MKIKPARYLFEEIYTFFYQKTGSFTGKEYQEFFENLGEIYLKQNKDWPVLI